MSDRNEPMTNPSAPTTVEEPPARKFTLHERIRYRSICGSAWEGIVIRVCNEEADMVDVSLAIPGVSKRYDLHSLRESPDGKLPGILKKER